MSKYPNRSRLLFNASFVLIALVIIIDFSLPGRRVEDEIVNVKAEQQQYYNAANNHHYSYQLITREHQFYVSEGFAESIRDERKIEYSVSRIFKEVNGYKSLFSDNREVSSLRIVSGLVLPLLMIVAMLVSYLYKKSIETLLFVLQVSLVADLIYLLL